MIHAYVLADQVRTLYRQTPVVLVTNCVNTVVVSLLSWGGGQQGLLLGWMGLTLLLTAARLWLFWSYRRATRTVTEAKRWGQRWAWGSGTSGLLWGAASAALLQGAGPSAQLTIIFFAGGMCTAAAAGLARYLPAFAAFASPTLLALIWGLVAFQDPLHQAMAVVVLLYGAGLFFVARVNHLALSEAFGLRFENTELLATVRQAQRDLEETNRTLEKRVAERSETVRKQVEALRDARRLEAVGRLAGGIAHDFNNLLTVVLVNIGELLSEHKLDPGTKANLREMDEAASRGADLVRQLLAFGRQQPNSPETLDLNLALGKMQGWLARLLGETLTLEVVLRSEPVFVRMDPTQMDQVIINLITNARDAVAASGRISIETEEVELSDAEDLPPGRYAVLSVTDTGVGMDPETRQRIFEPFFTTKEIGKGTGLGLATAHGIVEQAYGKIRVSSEPGRGSCFRVYLPLAVEPERAQVRAPTDSGFRETLPARRGATILLVEDESAIRAGARRILTRAGHHVLAAQSAEVALKLSLEHQGPLDLLVTDVVMTGMNGPDLAARLSPLRPEMQTLFMSGYSGDQVLDHSQGGAAFLAKPFTSEELLTAVTALLAEQATFSAQRKPVAGG
jgi:signal transduction histidine kinase/ActR/RegA family two-component response regulator